MKIPDLLADCIVGIVVLSLLSAILLLLLSSISAGYLDVSTSGFLSLVMATIVAMMVLLFFILVYGCIAKRPCSHKTDTTEKDWQTVQRGFVLWTLLVPERDSSGLEQSEMTARDRKIRSICDRMASTLTDEDFDTLMSIDPVGAEMALRLLDKFNPMNEE